MTGELKLEDGTELLLESREGQRLATLLPGVKVHHFRLAGEGGEAGRRRQPGADGWTAVGGARRGHAVVGFVHPVSVYLSQVSRDALLSLPLTTDQVLALERERDGGELPVKVDFRATLPQSRKYPFAKTQVHFRVPASDGEWQIENVHRGAFFTVTVPLPVDDGPLAEAAKHLLTAKRQITAGEYQDVIRETRLAIQIMRDRKVWPRDIPKRDDQDQADRYGAMLNDLDSQAEGYQQLLQKSFHQASGPQHAEGPIGRATWVRADAVSLTGMAASLMHRLAEEIRDCPRRKGPAAPQGQRPRERGSAQLPNSVLRTP
jgi:hypothetical protein